MDMLHDNGQFPTRITQLAKGDLKPNGYIVDINAPTAMVAAALVLEETCLPVPDEELQGLASLVREDDVKAMIEKATWASEASTTPERQISSQAPKELHTAFDPATEVQKRDPKRFQKVKTFADADRNRGVVNLMWDTVEGKYVIAKLMPNWWVGSCHAEFVKNHPGETEHPWEDIGCTRFLNGIGYPYGVTLLGVYRDDERTEVVTTFATEGDLFMWCSRPESPPPGPVREELVRPLILQLLHGVKQLHDLGIVHRDISLENVLVSKTAQQDSWRLLIIDYGMSSTGRYLSGSRGKRSYQAPEVHEDGEYDGFVADNFSAGVVMWCVLVNDYPWLSTRPGTDKCFEYYRKYGFKSYISKRALRNSTTKISEILSEPVQELLEGLLRVDPRGRLTLGETGVCESRETSFCNDEKDPTTRFHMPRSVWDEEWMKFEQPVEVEFELEEK